MKLKILWIFLLSAILLDLFIPFILGTKYSGYSHLSDTVSELGTLNSPVHFYESANLVVVGLLFLFFAFGQSNLFENKIWAHYLYTTGVIVFALGCILAGFFPEDAKGVLETTSGKIHGIASGLGFIFLILNPLWALWIKEFKLNQHVNSILFLLGIVSFALFLFSEKKTEGILSLTGLYQRINMLILYVALVINHYRL